MRKVIISLMGVYTLGSSMPSWAVNLEASPRQQLSTAQKPTGENINYISLFQRIADLHIKIVSLRGTEAELVQLAKSAYSELYNSDLRSIDSNLDMNSARSLLNLSFEARLALRAQIQRLSQLQLVDNSGRGQNLGSVPQKETFKAVRDLARALRYFEDIVGETAKLGPGFSGVKGAVEVGLASDDGVTLLNSVLLGANARSFTIDDLKSGDVFMIRGSTYNSAAIARIGDIDAQYSHQSIVFVDESAQAVATKPKKDRTFVIESLVETGVVYWPIEQYLREHAGTRMSVLRQRDSVLASKAGRWAMDLVTTQQADGSFRDNGKIRYNFTMDLNVVDKIFCSQLLFLAYQQASLDIKFPPGGRIQTVDLAGADYFNLMLRPTILSDAYKKFTSIMGVSAQTTYAPGDIEMDPRFDLLAEWRNFSEMKASRHKDFIVTKWFEWLERDQFKFQPTPVELGLATIAYTTRRLPIIGSVILEKDIPINQSVKSIASVIMLQFAGEVFRKALVEEETRILAENQLTVVPPKQDFEAIERVILKPSVRDQLSQWIPALVDPSKIQDAEDRRGNGG